MGVLASDGQCLNCDCEIREEGDGGWKRGLALDWKWVTRK